MIQWSKIISSDFHHIPKLSIGFKFMVITPMIMKVKYIGDEHLIIESLWNIFTFAFK